MKIVKGFTLIELLVVISIIGLLSSIIVSSLQTARESARDARRLQDARQIVTALELYYSDHGQYPEETAVDDCSGWECSQNDDGEFLDPLVDEGYLATYIVDPVNIDWYHYRYFRYENFAAGCEKEYFYVFGIFDFERTKWPNTDPHPDSPGWSCSGRDWQTEFDWVTGSFE